MNKLNKIKDLYRKLQIAAYIAIVYSCHGCHIFFSGQEKKKSNFQVSSIQRKLHND